MSISYFDDRRPRPMRKPTVYSRETPEDFVTLQEARAQVVENPGDDDQLLKRYILSAVESVERDTNIMLGIRPVLIRWREFPVCLANRVLEIPTEAFPIRKVKAITYRDSDGAIQSLTDYEVELYQRPAFLSLPPHVDWPIVTNGYLDTFQIEVTAGIAPDGHERCIELAKQAALLLVGHWYANRETVIVGTISSDIDFAYKALTEQLQLNRYVH